MIKSPPPLSQLFNADFLTCMQFGHFFFFLLLIVFCHFLCKRLFLFTKIVLCSYDFVLYVQTTRLLGNFSIYSMKHFWPKAITLLIFNNNFIDESKSLELKYDVVKTVIWFDK